MDWRAILAIPFVVSFAVLILLAIINRRTLIGDRVDQLTDYSADVVPDVIKHGSAPDGR